MHSSELRQAHGEYCPCEDRSPQEENPYSSDLRICDRCDGRIFHPEPWEASVGMGRHGIRIFSSAFSVSSDGSRYFCVVALMGSLRSASASCDRPLLCRNRRTVRPNADFGSVCFERVTIQGYASTDYIRKRKGHKGWQLRFWRVGTSERVYRAPSVFANNAMETADQSLRASHSVTRTTSRAVSESRIANGPIRRRCRSLRARSLLQRI
jgi:hypothetical protein